MIRITNIRKCHVPNYDEIYIIARSIASLEKRENKLLNNAVHLPELSPSKSLFYKYLDWKRANEWNRETFIDKYRPAFLEEMQSNPSTKQLLNILYEKDKAGKKIALLCFCEDENLCHRSIVGDMLRERGCNVVFDRDIKH